MNITVNYSNQGYSSLCATSSFALVYQKMREMGINGYCEGIVHDSTTGNVPINKIFEVYLICQRWFRQLIKERFNMDYRFDIDLSVKKN